MESQRQGRDGLSDEETIQVSTAGLELTQAQRLAYKLLFEAILEQAFRQHLRGNITIVVPLSGTGDIGIIKVEAFHKLGEKEPPSVMGGQENG